jgi:hypothetical protein
MIVSDAPNRSIIYDHKFMIVKLLQYRALVLPRAFSSKHFGCSVIPLIKWFPCRFMMIHWQHLLSIGSYFVRNTPNIHGRFINKGYIFKYLNISKIGAILRLFFLLALLAMGFSIRILLFFARWSWTNLKRAVAKSKNTLCWIGQFFCIGIQPMNMVDSPTKNVLDQFIRNEQKELLWIRTPFVIGSLQFTTSLR